MNGEQVRDVDAAVYLGTIIDKEGGGNSDRKARRLRKMWTVSGRRKRSRH